MHLDQDVVRAGNGLVDVDDPHVGRAGGLEDLHGAHGSMMTPVEPSLATARPRGMRGRLAAALVVLLGITGCTQAPSGHRGERVDDADKFSGPPSSIEGQLLGIGGPSGSGSRPWPGTVTVTASDGRSTTVHTDARGRFSLALGSGPARYTLTGHSRHYGEGVCRGTRAVALHEHQTVHVDVLCQLK